MRSEIERRLDPRADARIGVEVLGAPREPHRMETVNLSSSGALCKSGKFLPLNSMVRCRLLLPPSGGQGARTVETDAIVLRVGSGTSETRYLVTLYFVDMAAVEREALRQFVFSQLGVRPDAEHAPLARKA